MELASNPALSSTVLIAVFYAISIPFVILFVRLTTRAASRFAIGQIYVLCVVGLWLVFVAVFGLWEGWNLSATIARVAIQLLSFSFIFAGALVAMLYRLGSSTMAERSGKAMIIGVFCALLNPVILMFLACGILRDCI